MIGAVLAVGLLAKLNFIAMLPGRPARRRAARLARRGGARRSWARALACGIAAAVAGVYILMNLTVWDRTEWGGGVGVATRAATGSGSHAADPISLSYHLSYTWQLYLPRLPFMDPQFSGFRPWEIWFKGFIGNFGWLDTPFRLWVYNLALGITVPIVILACVTLWQRRAGLLRGAGRSCSPTPRSWAACSCRSACSGFATGATPASSSSRRATCSRWCRSTRRGWRRPR